MVETNTFHEDLVIMEEACKECLLLKSAEEHIVFLKNKIKQLEKKQLELESEIKEKATALSWIENPDRMGK